MERRERALQKLHDGTVIPATPLALDESRHLNERRQRATLRYYLDSGVGGLAVAVHTTQFEIRDPEHDLLEPVLRIAKEEASAFEERTGEVIVMVAGVCGPLEQALREADLAKSLGYDAVLLSPGGLNGLTEDEMIERTRAVAKIIPVIGFYLQTSVGGRVFTYDYWKRFCDIENVVAIKAAPFNRYYTLDVVRAAAVSKRADEITLYTGNDDNIVIDLTTTYEFNENGRICKKGFTGGLLGHWSVWTRRAVEMFEKCKAARESGVVTPELLTLAAQVTDTNAAFFDTANGFAGCIAGLHYVLKKQGLFEGLWCLDPDETVSKGQIEEIERVYKAYPHLNDDDFVAANLEKWLDD